MSLPIFLEREIPNTQNQLTILDDEAFLDDVSTFSTIHECYANPAAANIHRDSIRAKLYVDE